MEKEKINHGRMEEEKDNHWRNEFTVFIALVIASLSFGAGAWYGNNVGNGQPIYNVKAGEYHAFLTHKAFNPYTGEPVYWVIGTELKLKLIPIGNTTVNAEVIQETIQFYQIPRSRVTNLPHDDLLNDIYDQQTGGLISKFDYEGKITVK
ncbi:MAG: hypothetical protein NTZ49_02035 [Candidatus Parcubacteria bacterium]|nr:hypothetical protein [Candidatus Parcubacteria bacterium]